MNRFSNEMKGKQYTINVQTIYKEYPKVFLSDSNSKIFKKKSNICNFSFWRRHCTEFLKTTGFHGYKYVAIERGFSRLFWIVAVIVCLVLAIVFVISAWNWNLMNSTITVIESTHFPIWRYPYPAVSICPMNVIKRSSLATLKTLVFPENTTKDEVIETLRSATVLWGNLNVNEEMEKQFQTIQRVLESNNLTFVDFMNMIRPKCSDILTRCSWKGLTTRCNTLFEEVLTSSGFCCSFNYYALKMMPGTEKKSYFVPNKPRKVAGCGYQTALTVLLNISPNEYFTTFRGMIGLKILVHYSFNYPDDNSANKYIDAKTENFFAVAPEMTYSTEGVYDFSIRKRNCYFPSELKLKYFVKYTYVNCMAECRSNFVHELCSCIPFFLPNNGSLPTCNFTDIKCVYKARQIFYSSYPKFNNKTCSCLPDCQQYSYPLELSTGKLVRTNEYNSFSVFKDMKISNHTLAHIYFNDLVTTRFRKDVYMNWQNLLASFGGLLGLFIGFSLVSGFELIYFFTLRLFFDLDQRQKKSSVEREIWKDITKAQIIDVKPVKE